MGLSSYRSIKSEKSQAFTVVELVVVITVMAILAAITIVGYTTATRAAEESDFKADLLKASKNFELYKLDKGFYPTGSATVALTAAGHSMKDGAGYKYVVSSVGYCLESTTSRKKIFNITNKSGAAEEGACPSAISLSCPDGFIHVPGDSRFGTADFCVMKYEARNVGGVPTSRATGNPWVSINHANAKIAAQKACDGCRLITDPEWMTIAANVLRVSSNWSGGAVGSGHIYSGHNDGSPANAIAASTNDASGYVNTGNTTGNQRRTLTLSNGEVIWDFAGNVRELTDATIRVQPGPSGGGPAWRQFNEITDWGDLSVISRPSAMTSTISGIGSWTSTQGIGRIYSSKNYSVIHVFIRGGYWSDGANGGVLSLLLNNATAGAHSYLGFRTTSPGY